MCSGKRIGVLLTECFFAVRKDHIYDGKGCIEARVITESVRELVINPSPFFGVHFLVAQRGCFLKMNDASVESASRVLRLAELAKDGDFERTEFRSLGGRGRIECFEFCQDGREFGVLSFERDFDIRKRRCRLILFADNDARGEND